MKSIKKIFKNLKWLFGNPPTFFTQLPPDGILKCNYCGATNSLTNYVDVFCHCNSCFKKVFDSILLKENFLADGSMVQEYTIKDL